MNTHVGVPALVEAEKQRQLAAWRATQPDMWDFVSRILNKMIDKGLI